MTHQPPIWSIYKSKTWNRGYVHQSGTIHLGHPDIRRSPIRSIYESKTWNRGYVHQSGTAHLGHPVIKRHPIQSVYNSKTQNRGNSKLLGRITVIVFNVPSPYIYHFSKLLKKICGATPFAGNHSIHQIWACANLFGTLIYSTYKISSIFFLWQYLKQKFSKYKKLFYIF